MDDATYRRMLDAYPPIELFEYIPKVGHKYSLSEKYHPKQFHAWVAEQPVWREFHRWIKSDDFIYGIMGLLQRRSIDLGFDAPKGLLLRTGKRLKNLVRGEPWVRAPWLTARFEFSALPADGGSVTPHTDNFDKIVTMVVSMAEAGEWDPAWGGGTDVNRHKDPARSFNRMNGKAEFSEMEILETYPFEPNQAVLFVKTFNSWHSVRPMTGKGSTAMRRTLTINIEAHY
jgi:hypothetical protein